MSSIFGISSAGSADELQPMQAVEQNFDTQAVYEAQDTVEISLAARLAAAVHSSPEIRADLIERVRAEILAGTYETEDKIEATVDRILWEFEGA